MDNKAKRKFERNFARIKSCKCHNFDWKGDLKAYRQRSKDVGVIIPVFEKFVLQMVRCRCKSCGGTMSLNYAAPYMDAIKHIEAMNLRCTGDERK